MNAFCSEKMNFFSYFFKIYEVNGIADENWRFTEFVSYKLQCLEIEVF